MATMIVVAAHRTGSPDAVRSGKSADRADVSVQSREVRGELWGCGQVQLSGSPYVDRAAVGGDAHGELELRGTGIRYGGARADQSYTAVLATR